MAFLRVFPGQDIVAVFDEAAGGGDILDIGAARNGPAKNPTLHMDKVRFHSDFDYYELVAGPTVVNVSHPSLAGYTSPDLGIKDIAIYVTGQSSTNDTVLLTHNLGYKPRYFVAYNGAMLTNGTAVQVVADGRGRFVTTFATTTQIKLREFIYSTNLSTAAVSRSYEVMVFKEPVVTPSMALFEFDGSVLSIGRGRIKSTNKYLRRVLAAESSFDIDLGATMDVAGGRVRVHSGGNAYTEAGYSGSFTGPPFIPVGGVA